MTMIMAFTIIFVTKNNNLNIFKKIGSHMYTSIYIFSRSLAKVYGFKWSIFVYM